MNTDTDALAAYFEAWREGWPVPACLPVVDIGIIKDDGDLSSFMDKDIAEFSEALTGVLVVELARRWHCLYSVSEGQSWRVASESGNRVGAGPTPLCAIVAAWLEVNK